MPIENDINSFKMWASRMGCPIHCIPTDEALNSIFRSRQSSLMFNVMDRVRPLEEVKTIRRNIFISRMKKISGKLIEKCERGFGPREFQRYCEIQDLEKEKLLIESKLKESKEKCNQDLLKAKILQKEKLSTIIENLNVKCNILDLKYEDLEKNLIEEKDLKEKVLKLIPTKLTSLNISEENAFTAIADACFELDKFYTICVTSSNSHYIDEVKEELWSKLRDIFSKIPNSSLWNVLMRLKEEQLQKMKDLNNFMNKNNNFKDNSSIINEFELQLMKTKASVLGLASKYILIKQEETNLNAKFTLNYNKFCNDIQLKINAFGIENSDEEEEILSDYIAQYNTYSYNQGQKDFLLSEIDKCKKNVDDGNKLIEDHEILLGSLKQMYNEIETTVRRTQNEVMQLNQIKDKIQYSKSLLQHIINDIQLTRQQFANKNKTNLSGESFHSMNLSMSVDSLRLSPPGPGLSSTRLDSDIANSTILANTTMRGNSSICHNMTAINNLPQYTIELATFKDIPIQKFKIMPKECQMSILMNPLLSELSEPLSLLQHCPGFLLRPEVALSNFKSKIEWYKQLQSLNTNIRPDSQLPEIDETHIKNKLSTQNDDITCLIDEVEEIGINSERVLTKSHKYYDFLLSNPLKQFIPSTKLVNNQTYSDYDAEYNMYYLMVTSSLNFKKS